MKIWESNHFTSIKKDAHVRLFILVLLSTYIIFVLVFLSTYIIVGCMTKQIQPIYWRTLDQYTNVCSYKGPSPVNTGSCSHGLLQMSVLLIFNKSTTLMLLNIQTIFRITKDWSILQLPQMVITCCYVPRPSHEATKRINWARKLKFEEISPCQVVGVHMLWMWDINWINHEPTTNIKAKTFTNRLVWLKLQIAHQGNWRCAREHLVAVGQNLCFWRQKKIKINEAFHIAKTD